MRPVQRSFVIQFSKCHWSLRILTDYLLGIDIGTTACKTALFNIHGRLIEKASQEYPVLYPKQTWAEQDADVWWRAARSNVRAIAKRIGRRSERIVGIGVDSQREAVVPVDARGRRLANSLIWLDRRTVTQSKEIAKRIPLRKVIRTTGVPINYFYSATKIMWM